MITDADQAAAHETMRNVRGYAVKLPYDEHWLIQAFAAHRLAAEKETLERAARVAEECEMFDGDYLKHSDPRRTVAAAIRGMM